MTFVHNPLAGAAGFIALANLTTVPRQTALKGTSSYLDALVLCPGLHTQQSAPELSKGEFPACAAMTTGYVFRVENEATVLFLQKIARTGHLTTLSVRSEDMEVQGKGKLLGVNDPATLLLAGLTLATVAAIVKCRDWWALLFLLVLILARFINVVVVKRRASCRWKGQSEPGVRGDLLILLSRDRWVRIQGAVDDLKAVIAGQWLRDQGIVDGLLVSSATLLTYFDVVVAANATWMGNVAIVGLLVASALLVSLTNDLTDVFKMKGRVIAVIGKKSYARRLELAEELIRQTGRDDWAIRLGMILREKAKDESEKIM